MAGTGNPSLILVMFSSLDFSFALAFVKTKKIASKIAVVNKDLFFILFSIMLIFN
jgi:hypothetical protein